VERPLNAWEHAVIVALAAVESAHAHIVRESIPHLVVAGGCECDSASFNVRDSRYPPRRHTWARIAELMRERGELAVLLRKGAERAQAVASKDPHPGVCEHRLPAPVTSRIEGARCSSARRSAAMSL
jgi:hypothetical protein